MDFAIRRLVHNADTEGLKELADSFDRLAAALLKSPWAHGDLKPENIIIDSKGELRLIDYDSLYASALTPRGLTGTLNYQHPCRNETFYNKHIDDYSIALISVSLHALAAKPALLSRYNGKDNIIMYPEAIIAGTDKCMSEIRTLFADDKRMTALCMALESTSPEINDLISLIECIQPK